MRAAIILLFIVGAAAIGLGVWLQLGPTSQGGALDRPPTERRSLSVSEVRFPAALEGRRRRAAAAASSDPATHRDPTDPAASTAASTARPTAAAGPADDPAPGPGRRLR